MTDDTDPAFAVGDPVAIAGLSVLAAWRGCRGDVVEVLGGPGVWPLPVRVRFRCAGAERVEWFAEHELTRDGEGDG